ncbi:hypothetical protein APY04_2791 [Hyphomicrobium sulfonivorans]|uniref:Uncharacterized protein n=1 Tax=Hyphomicrobium sulfonivorans TaxID=121290 RepID=A0A109BB61_HYPSL|nr:hypothetical protein APY04_2791 [Hyphomicrobium sulfonivorans]
MRHVLLRLRRHDIWQAKIGSRNHCCDPDNSSPSFRYPTRKSIGNKSSVLPRRACGERDLTGLLSCRYLPRP